MVSLRQQSPWELSADAFFRLDRARVKYLAMCQIGIRPATKLALEEELSVLELAAEKAAALASAGQPRVVQYDDDAPF